MANNKGYLTSKRTPEHQEMYTPYYAVDPIVKYIPKQYKIWCPFDKEWSAFYRTFKTLGYDVIRSHIDEGQDFFLYEPEGYDIIISNPPFSIKDKILERLYELEKPFAVLLPLNSLQGKSRYKFFSKGIQLLSFDQRIGFHNESNMDFIKFLAIFLFELKFLCFSHFFDSFPIALYSSVFLYSFCFSFNFNSAFSNSV